MTYQEKYKIYYDFIYGDLEGNIDMASAHYPLQFSSISDDSKEPLTELISKLVNRGESIIFYHNIPFPNIKNLALYLDLNHSQILNILYRGRKSDSKLELSVILDNYFSKNIIYYEGVKYLGVNELCVGLGIPYGKFKKLESKYPTLSVSKLIEKYSEYIEAQYPINCNGTPLKNISELLKYLDIPSASFYRRKTKFNDKGLIYWLYGDELPNEIPNINISDDFFSEDRKKDHSLSVPKYSIIDVINFLDLDLGEAKRLMDIHGENLDGLKTILNMYYERK